MPHRDLLAEQPFITGDAWQQRHARHRQRIRLMRPVTTTRNDSLPLARQLDRNKRADGVLKLEQRRQVDIGNAVLARHLTDIYAAPPAVPNPDTSRRIPRRQRDEEEVQRALQNARLAKRIASQGSVLANRVNWHQHSQEHDQHVKRLQRTREFGVDRDLMKLMDPAHPLVKSKRSSAKQPQDPSTSSSSSSSSSACSSGAATARSRSGTDPAALHPPAQPRQSRSRPRHAPAPPASSSASSTLERLRRVDSRADAKEDADAAAAQEAEDLYVQSIMRPSHPVPPTPPSVGRSLLPSPNPRLARRSFPLPDALDDDDSPFPSPGAAPVPGPATFPLAPKRTLRQHPPLPRGNPLFGIPLE